MKSIFTNKWVLLFLRLLIGAIFIYAGMLKIRTPQAFADSIHTFEILPPSLINLLALGLPPFEIISGMLFILGWQKRLISFSLLVLSGLFILALLQGLIRDLPIDCGCFGNQPPSVWKNFSVLGRDILLFLALSFIYTQAKRESV